MAGKLFDRLEREAFRGGITARTKKSMQWFRTRVSQMRTPSRKGLITDQRQRATPIFGSMAMMFYDPKHKKTLPYYDRFPLVIPFQKAKDGFLGMNLHYLPHTMRAQFLDALYDTVNNTKYDDTTKMMINYNLIKSVSQKPFYKATVKHYLTKHIRSKIALVDSADWEIAIFLPVEQFKKAGIKQVYSDSRKAMR
jgi:hypothetical protein